jgi:hypothetical protein
LTDTERIACRILVGDAGQRVQGFLTRPGLDHSYVGFDAFPYMALRAAALARSRVEVTGFTGAGLDLRCVFPAPVGRA